MAKSQSPPARSQESARQQELSRNAPVFTCRHRALKAAVWKNETETGPMYNTTLTRSYKETVNSGASPAASHTMTCSSSRSSSALVTASSLASWESRVTKRGNRAFVRSLHQPHRAGFFTMSERRICVSAPTSPMHRAYAELCYSRVSRLRNGVQFPSPTIEPQLNFDLAASCPNLSARQHLRIGRSVQMFQPNAPKFFELGRQADGI